MSGISEKICDFMIKYSIPFFIIVTAFSIIASLIAFVLSGLNFALFFLFIGYCLINLWLFIDWVFRPKLWFRAIIVRLKPGENAEMKNRYLSFDPLYKRKWDFKYSPSEVYDDKVLELISNVVGTILFYQSMNEEQFKSSSKSFVDELKLKSIEKFQQITFKALDESIKNISQFNNKNGIKMSLIYFSWLISGGSEELNLNSKLNKNDAEKIIAQLSDLNSKDISRLALDIEKLFICSRSDRI